MSISCQFRGIPPPPPPPSPPKSPDMLKGQGMWIRSAEEVQGSRQQGVRRYHKGHCKDRLGTL